MINCKLQMLKVIEMYYKEILCVLVTSFYLNETDVFD